MNRFSTILIIVLIHLCPAFAQHITDESVVVLDTLTSSTTIPLYPPVVDSVVCRSLSTDTGSAVTVYVSNIPDRKEYYKVFFRQGSDWKQFTSAHLGIVDDVLADSAIAILLFGSTLRDIPTNITGGRGYWFGYNSFVHTFHVAPGNYPGNR